MSASLLEHVGTFVPTLPKNIEASHSSLKLFIALFTVVLTSEHVDQLVFKVDKRRSIPLDWVLPESGRDKPRLVEAIARPGLPALIVDCVRAGFYRTSQSFRQKFVTPVSFVIYDNRFASSKRTVD